ncbi:phage portal protein [Azospirillum brasilense]|uniref:phage portal protein n=1 Tax=Azospirillum argentinense TaxID=2970906 RepID=UPI001909E274|nr:phage portal protein [Azospirillum argentinense]MBK3799458.1 phage portal protein [Azospirillum argentinense]
MSWLQRMFGQNEQQEERPRDPADDYWYSSLEGAVTATSGMLVTTDAALQLPVVLDCEKVLSETVCSLPIKVFRRLPNGGREEADGHPLTDLFAFRPNGFQTSWEFFGQMTWWLAWYRNAYAEIVPGPRGAVDQLVPHHPSCVTPRWSRSTGEVWYDVIDLRTGQRKTLHASEMLHLRALPFSADGLTGVPVTKTSGNIIGAALAVHAYGARFFKNDGQSGGLLEAPPGTFKATVDRDNWLSAWRRARTGSSQHKDAMLEHGIKYNRAQLDNQKGQFLETRNAMNEELARIWRVPQHKVGILGKATNNNIEQQAIEFVTDTILPILVLWERKINADLILRPDVYFAEFNVAGLLRGDLESRYKAFFQGRQGGWLSINDIRRMENMNPIPNGDDYLQPLNMAPAGAKPPAAHAPRAVLPEDLGLAVSLPQ